MKTKDAAKEWGKLQGRVERLSAFHAQLLEHKIKKKDMIKNIEKKVKETEQDLEDFWKKLA